MKNIILALAMLNQDASKDRIEMPIKNTTPTGSFDLSKTGIEWSKGLDSATGKGRPVFLFQLLGNLDEEFC